MKLKVVLREGAKEFQLEDDDTGEVVGTLQARLSLNNDLLPTVESLTRFQNAKLVVDGKSLKRLQRLNG